MQSLNIQPNPVHAAGSISISTKNNTEGMISVYDIMGNEISRTSTKGIDLRNIPLYELFHGVNIEQGLYLLHYFAVDVNVCTKLLVIN